MSPYIPIAKARGFTATFGNLIALNRTSFSLRLIHGYNHGTIIKEMLWNKFDNDRLKERKTVENNPGQTIFMIKEIA